MKKFILLCSFGLLGTFAIASNEVIEENQISIDLKQDAIEDETGRQCAQWVTVQIMECEPFCEEDAPYVEYTYCAQWVW